MSVNRDDIAEVGRAIYHEKILPTLGPEYKGKLVIIDVNSGNYEIGYNDLELVTRLIERNSDAFTWAERVGYDAPYKMEYRIEPTGP